MLTLLIVLWWTAAVLSTAVVAGLVAGLAWFAVGRLWRLVVRNGPRPTLLRRSGGATQRRRVALLWAIAALVWVPLEVLGAVFLLRTHWSGHSPLPAVLPRSPPGEIRLLAIGGSTIVGAPYHKWLSIPKIVGAGLAQNNSGIEVRVQNLGSGGASIADVYERLGKLDTRPDIVLVYTGHNEFLRFPPDREAGVSYYGAAPLSLMARVVAEEIERRSAHEGPLWRGRRRLFDQPVCTPGEARRIHRNFRRTLDGILRFVRAQGALTIVFLPAANDAGFAPNRSVLSSDRSEAEAAHIRAIYEDLGDPDLAPGRRRNLLKDARRLAPEFAETWYRLGRLYDRAGMGNKARRCYRRARDLDRFPVRAPSAFVNTVQTLARRHHAVIIDARRVLRDLDESGYLDGEVFHDNVHPNLPAHVALANAALDVVAGSRFGPRVWPDGRRVPRIHVRDVARRFGLERPAWIEVTTEEGDLYVYLSAYRYDVVRRLEKAQAYYDAAERMRQGIAPSEARIPGMRARAGWEY